MPGCVKTIFDFKMWGHVSFNVHFNDTHPYNVIIYQWKWGNFLFYVLNFEFSHSLIRGNDERKKLMFQSLSKNHSYLTFLLDQK